VVPPVALPPLGLVVPPVALPPLGLVVPPVALPPLALVVPPVALPPLAPPVPGGEPPVPDGLSAGSLPHAVTKTARAIAVKGRIAR
jgi:hypothetical protein